mgnify:CR=1 FL=1
MRKLTLLSAALAVVLPVIATTGGSPLSIAEDFDLRYEARDNPVSPTRGWFMSLSVAEGFTSGGAVDVSYTRTNFAASWYRPLTKKWRMAIGAQFASLISGEDVGMLKLLFNIDTMQLLGVHCFGAEATEIIHIGQAILKQEGSANDIRTNDCAAKWNTYSGRALLSAAATAGPAMRAI